MHRYRDREKTCIENLWLYLYINYVNNIPLHCKINYIYSYSVFIVCEDIGIQRKHALRTCIEKILCPENHTGAPIGVQGDNND